MKFNFKHNLFYSPKSENDPKYDYFTRLDKYMSLFDWATGCSKENKLYML